ncbi:MAG: inositol monophosphatase [Haloferacaceae archaeon]
MDETGRDDIARVAKRAARAGGEFLADEFRAGPVAGEFGTDDVRADVDRAAERRVRDVIRDAYPDHAFYSEESGRNEGTGIEWVVDPLDGTNNFASGIPSFATAVAALPDGGTGPLVSAIYEPLPDALYLARRGEGATVNGDPLSADSDLSLDRGTVSLVVGLPAIRDPDRAATAQQIERTLREQSKRVIQTWSPTVDFGLLARGAIEGLVYVHPQGHEQYAGSLLASESGVVSGERDDVYVGASNAETLAAIRSAVATAT